MPVLTPAGYGGTVNAIPYEELTVTVLRSRKPVKLFQYLMAKDGYSVTETAPGVYRINGMIDMVVQVVVIKALKDSVFLPLRIMVRDADEEEIKAFLREALTYDVPEDQNNARAVLNISSEANEETFEKIRRDDEMGEAMRRIMRDDIRESEQNTAKLFNYLWKNGRGEEAERAEREPDFLDKLLKEIMPVLTPAK